MPASQISCYRTFCITKQLVLLRNVIFGVDCYVNNSQSRIRKEPLCTVITILVRLKKNLSQV